MVGLLLSCPRRLRLLLFQVRAARLGRAGMIRRDDPNAPQPFTIQDWNGEEFGPLSTAVTAAWLQPSVTACGPVTCNGSTAPTLS